MLEHLKRILSSLIDWHKPQIIFDQETVIDIAGGLGPGEYLTELYDEFTILNVLDQVGRILVRMGRTQVDMLVVDEISFAADEVISRVYSTTGKYINYTIYNDGAAVANGSSLGMLRKT